MLTKMIFATLLLFVLSALNGYASEKKREANCTIVIAATCISTCHPRPTSFTMCSPSMRSATSVASTE